MNNQRKAATLRGVKALCAAAILFSTTGAWAQTTITSPIMTSPAGGQLPPEVTPIGGLVIDLVGINHTRVVSEIAAGDLFNGTSLAKTPIGTATGFTPALLSALGGGLASAAFRITLDDGDQAFGDFDYLLNTLYVNGVYVDNFSNVPTVETNYTGGTILTTNTNGGFRNGKLDTGFFTVTTGTTLAGIYSSLLTSGSLQFSLYDATPGDNILDFTAGIAAGYAHIGYLPGIGAPMQILQNASPVNTPTTVDYIARGVTITGGTTGSNTVNSLEFVPGSSFVISGTLTVSFGITSDAGGTSLISGGTLVGTGGLTFNLAGDQVVTSNIAGSTSLTKSGTATLVLTGANTYTGATNVIGGRLQVGNGGGSINNTSSITISPGAIFSFNLASNSVIAGNITNASSIEANGDNANIISGNISGAGSFTQNGLGLTLLAGTNSYTGNTVVALGTLQIGDGSTGTISSSSAVSVQSKGTLILNSPNPSLLRHNIANDGKVVLSYSNTSYTFSGAISGAGSLTKTGANTLILNGANSYAGATIVQGGILQVGAASAIPSQSALQVDSGATVNLNGFSQSVGSLAGDGNLITSPSTLFTAGANNSDTTFTGAISGSADIKKVGSGTWILGGNNTYSGLTTVSGGILQIGNGAGGSIDSSSSVVVDAGGTLAINMASNAVMALNILNNGMVQGNGANMNTISGVISGVGGFNQTGLGTTILTGSNTYAGSTIVSSGALQIGNGSVGTISPSSALAVGAGGTLILNSPDVALLKRTIPNDGTVVLQESGFGSYTFAGVINGAGGLTKTGANTLILDGTNSYSGATSVQGGVLQVASVTALPNQSALQVTSGATVDITRISQTVGSLSGDGNVVTGANTVLTTGSDNTNVTFSGVISGAADVAKVGSGVWNVSGPNTYTGATRIYGGAMLANGSLQGDVFVLGGILGGSGIIHGSVTNQAMVSPGNSPGTLTIEGNYTQTSAGALLIQIASPASYDRLVIGGTANLGGALVVDNMGNYQLRGNTYTFLTAAAGVSGTFSDISSASLLKLKLIYGPNSVAIESIYRIFSNVPGLTPNERAVAKVIDKLLDQKDAYSNTRLLNAVDVINNLPTKSVPAGLERVIPTDYVVLPDAGFALAQVQATNLEWRMEAIRSTLADYTADISAPSTFYTHSAISSGESLRYIDANGRELGPTPIEPHWGFFLNGSGEFVDDKTSAIAGNGKFTTGGVSMGGDYRFNDHVAAGLTVGYANTTTTGRWGGSTGIDGGDISAYATVFNNGYFLNGVLGGGASNYDMRRASLNGMAKGNATGTDFLASLGGGYTYNYCGFSGGPIASLRYCSVQIGGFNENGSLAPLDILSQDKASLKSTLGFQATYAIPFESVIIKPQAKAQWRHEYSNDSRDIGASISFQPGSSFTVSGPALGSDSLLVDLGVTVLITPTVSVYGYYSGDIGSQNYTSSSIIGGVQLNF